MSLLSPITNALGITSNAPPSAEQSESAKLARSYAQDAMQKANNFTRYQPGQVAAPTVQAQNLDQTQANQARDVTQQNIADLQGVASGRTPTAAEVMFGRGSDAARAQAMGTAAALSRNNPGQALRAGLQAGNQAQMQATGAAAQQKAEDMANARTQIGALANAMRGQDLGAAQANQNAQNQIGQFNAQQGMNAQQLNQGAGLQANQQNNQYQLGEQQIGAGLTTAPLQAAITNQQVQQQNNQANQAGVGGLVTTLDGILSDERAKKNVRPRALADAYAKDVRGVTFEYKPEVAPSDGPETGVIAQDVEKVVPTAVGNGPGGLKVIDTRKLTTANTAAIGELARRLRRVEGRGAAA
jgi:hypothetical protein